MGLTTQPAPRLRPDAKAASLTTEILARMFDDRLRRFSVRLWDGTEIPASEPPRFTLVLNDPGALRHMFVPPTELALGEAFLRGHFDVEGDLEAAFGLSETLLERVATARDRLDLARMLMALPRSDRSPVGLSHRSALRGPRHSLARDRAAIAHHYDVGNDYFGLWLDRRLVYSCAYFERDDQPLDEAQEAKLDLICRKLCLRPGERLLDIGCGWGALVIHAAQRFGVHALGVTLSRPQVEYAGRAIHDAGLADRCRVEPVDYRDLRGEVFDKIASIGMFEHVGRDRLSEYFSAAFNLLRPGGLFLNHGIASRWEPPTRPLPWRRDGSFTQRYVFPDGELVPISTALDEAERAGLEVRDVESLREHYMMTLRHWVRRLEARKDDAVRIAGQEIYRIWRLFMSGSAYGFATGRLSVFQALLARSGVGGRVELPLTRAHLVPRHAS